MKTRRVGDCAEPKLCGCKYPEVALMAFINKRGRWDTNVLCLNCGIEGPHVGASHVAVGESIRLWNKMDRNKHKEAK